jgi:fumarate hydratase class II
MTRIEHDSLGEVKVADDVLWGAQTQRAKDNFHIKGPMPNAFIRALALIKVAAAKTNLELGELPENKVEAIMAAGTGISKGEHADQFPVDIYQTGSGTSTNMNVNEVIAHLCGRAGVTVHPNDDVNHSQSSNDTVPTAIHLSALLALTPLQTALAKLDECLVSRATELAQVVKPGRTHLMDAMPVTFGQVLTGWRTQLAFIHGQLRAAGKGLAQLPQGGTAVGTGVNCPDGFRDAFCRHLSEITSLSLEPLATPFAGQSAIDRPLALSSALRALAIFLVKISNDLRWMNSGPLHGLADITLPALQPGSSIMPGKVNPVACEAVVMAATQVQGLDHAVAIAAQVGNFELNVMLPLVANNLLEMESLLTHAVELLAEKAIAVFEPNLESLKKNLARNPILVTALNPVIGYEKAAHIAHLAYDSGRAVLDVAMEETGMSEAELEKLLDPLKLTGV